MPTTPKKPQDRKPKAVEEPKVNPEDVPGWELLRDLADVPVWDQTPLISKLQKAIEAGEDNGDGTQSFDINVIGEMSQAMLPYAKDEAAYTKFVSGAGAMERAMNLAMAWVGQMGEFGSSDAS